MFSKFSLNRLLVLFVAAGFLFLLIDSVVEHWDVFAEERMAFIPVVFSAFGFLVSAIAVARWKESSIRLVHVTLMVTFAITAAGLYFHVEEEDDDEQLTAEKREHEEKEKEKPVLAPLSFAGLAAVGLLGTSRKWQADVI